jgi:SAM-dependent methyltransferase
MNLKDLKRTWDELGKKDPLWGIVSSPEKKGNRWEEDEFFRLGTEDIKRFGDYVAQFGFHIGGGKALDFGCGVGRLTQALAPHFEEVYGVDIAPAMIELAEKYNKYGKRCKYIVNDKDNLRMFADNSFNFIISHITLQHMEPRYSKRYILEFLRVLAPKGLLIFQQPSERVFVPNEVYRGSSFLKILREGYRKIFRRYDDPNMCMKLEFYEVHGIKKEEILRILEKKGVRVIDIVMDGSAGVEWISYRYCVTKDI